MTLYVDYRPVEGSPFEGWGPVAPKQVANTGPNQTVVVHRHGITVYRKISPNADEGETLTAALPLASFEKAFLLMQSILHLLVVLGVPHKWTDGSWPDLFSFFENEGID